MVCEKCGIEIDGLYGSGRFCGRKCANSRDTAGRYVNRVCINCGIEISVKINTPEMYVKCPNCKKKEKRKKSNDLNGRDINGRVIKLGIKKYCKNCEKELKSGLISFCCWQCGADYKVGEIYRKIMESNGLGFTARIIKKFLISSGGNICSICGLSEWMGKPIPIIIDHINGRASENNLDNLRLVCANCDAQLPTYKSKNKNSDRKRLGKYL